MALIVETGTGSATANSCIEDADFTAWATIRFPGTDLKTSTDREPHIIRAADYLRNESRFPYRGLKKTADQTQPYPRTGVVERRGQAISDSIVPYRYKEAQCFLAYLSFTGVDLQPALPRGGQVLSKTIGPISTSFAPNANPETLYPFVLGLLAPLLRESVSDVTSAVPTLTELPDVRGFMPGEFDPLEAETT